MASKTIDFLVNLKDNATRGFKNLQRAADGATDALTRTESKAADAGGKLASLGGVIGGIPVPGFEKLGHVVTAAGDSIEALSNPVSASIVLIGGYGAAVAAATAGVVALVAASDEWIEELREAEAFDGLIGREQLRNIELANQTMGALGTQTKRVGVLLAAEFAPAVNAGAEVMLVLGRNTEEFLQAVEGTGLAMDVFVTTLAGPLTAGALNFAENLEVVKLNLLGISSAAGKTREELTKLDEQVANSRFEALVSGRLQDRIAGLGDFRPAVAAAQGAGKAAGKAADTALAKDMAQAARDRKAMIDMLQMQVDAEKKAAAQRASLEQLQTFANSVALDAVRLNASLEEMFRESFNKLLLVGLSQARSTEDIVRAIPVVGDFIADAGEAILNLPNTIKGMRQDLVKGPERIGKAFERTMTRAIPALIRSLPQVLEGLLFKMPAAIARGFVKGFSEIGQALGDLIKDALQAILGVFRGTTEKARRLDKRLDKAGLAGLITDPFQNFLANIGVGDKKKDKDKRKADDFEVNTGAAFATGTSFVPRTGLAMVHEGEAIIPTSGADSGSTRARRRIMDGASGMNMSVTIQAVHANSPFDFIRQLRRELGTLGTGASLTPFA